MISKRQLKVIKHTELNQVVIRTVAAPSGNKLPALSQQINKTRSI